MMIDRRGLFTALGTAGAAAAWPRIAFAAGPTDKRLVVIILRGAMDGLTAVPSTPRPGEAGGALALADVFGLHPARARS